MDITVGDEGGITMATVGHMLEFSPETEIISSYLERLDLYFDANSVAAGKQVSVLLTMIGSKYYDLLRGLGSPRCTEGSDVK